MAGCCERMGAVAYVCHLRTHQLPLGAVFRQTLVRITLSTDGLETQIQPLSASAPSTTDDSHYDV